MRRILLPLFALCNFLIAVPATGQVLPNTSLWLQDFRQLKNEMSAHYANLEWAVTARRMDLAALSSRTETLLRSAGSDAAARTALQIFIASFGDGHLEIRFPSATTNTPPNTAAMPAGVCVRQRYIQRAPRIRIPFDKLPELARIDNDDARYFPLGILKLPDNRRVGVIRIASFEDNVFLDLCEGAASQLRIAADSNCADACAELLDRETSNLITAALTRQIKTAQAHDISALVVDITHNGGGTNWVEAAARVFTPIGLKAPRTAFVRHPHHVQQLAEKIKAFSDDVKSASPEARTVLNTAIARLDQQKRQAEQPCDRNPLWEGKPITCSALVTEPATYATGALDYARPGSTPKLSSCCALFYPSRYRFEEGAYRGKLFVLIDRETASAAEYFAAILKDNSAAQLIGEATYGAGCGYTNGGIPTTLTHSGARVRMPDCVRYRADGTNEVEGVIPDVFVPWRPNDSEYQRAAKAYIGIRNALTH
jgi:hypothetical protein